MKVRTVSSISDAQSYISKLYPNTDRDFSYVFSYAARHVGYLGKSLNQKNPKSDEFIRTISWILALASKVGVDVEKAVVNRHPGICPYCVTSPCDCISTGKKPAFKISAHKIPDELRIKAEIIQRIGPVNFSDHAERLAKIYVGNIYTWRAIGPWLHTSKIQEELAEVHEAATRLFSGRKELSSVSEEFADLIAWILSAWKITFPSESFDDAFISFYLNGCPVCGALAKCTCSLFSDNSSQLVESEKIAELEKLFSELANAVGAKGEEIESVIRSLRVAATSQSEPVARSAVLETKKKAVELEKAVDRGAKNIGNITKIVEALGKLYDNFPFA